MHVPRDLQERAALVDRTSDRIFSESGRTPSAGQIADATGLTAVHVNRVIRGLEIEGVIERRGRALTLKEWGQIASAADFQLDHWRRSAA